MKLSIELGGRTRVVELARVGAGSDGGTGIDGRWRCAIDGREVACDAAQVAPGVFSILIGREAFEARVEAAGGGLRVHIAGREYIVKAHDPRRWRRGDGTVIESQGRQQVIAPMPGKIVRVLAKAGELIEAGQGIAVVEAMKMQNEVRSPKSGSVERMLVAEGQAVNAGDVIAVIL